jgi:hypothetical protein
MNNIRGRKLQTFTLIKKHPNFSPKKLREAFKLVGDPIGKSYLMFILRELTEDGWITKNSINTRRCTYTINEELNYKQVFVEQLKKVGDFDDDK